MVLKKRMGWLFEQQPTIEYVKVTREHLYGPKSDRIFSFGGQKPLLLPWTFSFIYTVDIRAFLEKLPLPKGVRTDLLVALATAGVMSSGNYSIWQGHLSTTAVYNYWVNFVRFEGIHVCFQGILERPNNTEWEDG